MMIQEQADEIIHRAVKGRRATFTPGPWAEGPAKKGQRGKLLVVDASGYKIADCEAERFGLKFARPLSVDTANARLIAAAPELYDLARMVVMICDSCNVEHIKLALMDNSPLVGEARLLIARIDGDTK